MSEARETSEPTFAVVGRVNEGKSSLVAALTENDDVPIGPDPGTTRLATTYPLVVDGERLFTIIDTPGFQEPEAVFAWLSARAVTAAERPAAIRSFLTEFADKERFSDERRLLEPVMAGASVLYVVDASHPFRASYELEMQILRWTGRPCFALVNHTRDPATAYDYEPEWSAALTQYFNAVRPFNAQRNDIDDRLGLLTMLAELDNAARPALLHAADVLRRRKSLRYERAAEAIADALIDLVSLKIAEPAPSGPARDEPISDGEKRRLEGRFHAEIKRREASARSAVESLFQHRRVRRVETDLPSALFDQDIFSEKVWQLLGQSPLRLVAAGALGGALVGGTIDAMTLGHSIFTGTLLGGGIGGIGSAIAALRAPDARVLGLSISRTETVVGPHQSQNFAWILLDRALLHCRAIATRAHSAQAPVDLADGKQGLVGRLSKTETARLERIFGELRRSKIREESRALLRATLAQLLPRL